MGLLQNIQSPDTFTETGNLQSYNSIENDDLGFWQ